jgi:hypothetical protein
MIWLTCAFAIWGNLVLAYLCFLVSSAKCPDIMAPVVESLLFEPGLGCKMEEHRKNARPSSREKHEEGLARKAKDKGREKGDKRRKHQPRKRRRPDKE